MAHLLTRAQGWIEKKCSGFIGKKTNGNRIRQISIHWIIMRGALGRYQKYTPKPTNVAELKTALLSIWNDLPQEFIDKAILSFRKRLQPCLLQLVDIFNTHSD